MVDWYKQEVLFHLQNAFNEQHRWFYLGFSKRGSLADADICFFENQNGFFNVVTDTYTSPDGHWVRKDYQQDCEVFKMDEFTLAFKRKFDTCDPLDLRLHVSRGEEKSKGSQLNWEWGSSLHFRRVPCMWFGHVVNPS